LSVHIQHEIKMIKCGSYDNKQPWTQYKQTYQVSRILDSISRSPTASSKSPAFYEQSQSPFNSTAKIAPRMHQNLPFWAQKSINFLKGGGLKFFDITSLSAPSASRSRRQSLPPASLFLNLGSSVYVYCLLTPGLHSGGWLLNIHVVAHRCNVLNLNLAESASGLSASATLTAALAWDGVLKLTLQALFNASLLGREFHVVALLFEQL